MREFKERLEKFAKTQYNMGQTRFEDYCKLAHGTISAIKSSGPSASVITRIAVSCPELNLNWLFSGEGSMLRSVDNPPKQKAALPLIPLEAVAGPGSPIYEDDNNIEYYSVPAFRDSDFLIRVKGDSMTPKFTGGDLIACKKIDIDSVYFIQWNRVYVVYTRSQGVMIKRIQPSENEECVKCVSDNEKYAPFDVPKNDIVALALVNGSISLE